MEQLNDAVSGVSGCACAPSPNDASWRARAGRAGKRGARFAAQLAVVVAVYAAGCALASVLPIHLPGNIVGMVLLLVLHSTQTRLMLKLWLLNLQKSPVCRW